MTGRAGHSVHFLSRDLFERDIDLVRELPKGFAVNGGAALRHRQANDFDAV